MKLVIAAALLLPLAAWAATRQQQPAALLTVEPELLPSLLPEPSFLETIGIMSMKSTRGERNNNPGNIRHGQNWQGEVQGGDGAFETFATPTMGIRALAKVLKNYQQVHGLRTVRAIVARWAPATENNTEAYIRAVAAELGVSPEQDLNLGDAGTLERLTAAIIRHENGRVIYSSADIAAAVRLA